MSVSVGFQNIKLPLDPHPLGSDVGDPLLTVGCSNWVDLDLGSARSVDSGGLRMAMNSPNRETSQILKKV